MLLAGHFKALQLVAPMAKRQAKTRQRKYRGTYRIFVSHATADKWVARALCDRLDAAGAITFRDDRDIAGGDRIPDAIIREIDRCDDFLVLLTPASVNRPWVLIEIGMALGRGLRRMPPRIVPIVYHVGVDPIPEMIKDRKAHELNSFDDYVNEVVKRMRRTRQ
jgi:hypothetical protein